MKRLAYILLLISVASCEINLRRSSKTIITEEEDDFDIFNRKEEEAAVPQNQLMQDLRSNLPEPVYRVIVSFNLDARMEKLNNEFKMYISEINLMGVPDPLDHVLFTVALILMLYVPTKFIHSSLDFFYGSSLPAADMTQQQSGPAENLSSVLSLVKQVEDKI